MDTTLQAHSFGNTMKATRPGIKIKAGFSYKRGLLFAFEVSLFFRI
ncbi:hypothetical protein [Paenibacillus sp. FSL K6-1558]